MPTDEAVLDRWDKFAELYAKNLANWSTAAHAACIAQLRLPEASSVLELACGPGHTLSRVRDQLSEAASYTATDVAPNMIKIASELGVAGVELSVRDAQKLPDEWTGKFDRVLSNLVYMIVPDATAAIESTAKVLQPGGLLAASIWGDRSKSHMFTLMKQVMIEEGIVSPIPAPVARPNFHLADEGDAAVRQRFLAAGFVKVVLWHQMCALPFLDGAAFANFWLGVNPTNVAMMAALPPADAERLRTSLAAKAEAILGSGMAIGLDTIIIVARKARGDAAAL